MPAMIGTTIHALPAPGATVTRCGLPLRQPGATPTKARVTCPECRRLGGAAFVAGWDDAIRRGVVGDEEPAGDAGEEEG